MGMVEVVAHTQITCVEPPTIFVLSAPTHIIGAARAPLSYLPARDSGPHIRHSIPDDQTSPDTQLCKASTYHELYWKGISRYRES